MIPNDRSGGEAEARMDFAALWRIVWGGRYLVIGVSLLCGVTAAIMSLVATPMYRAEAAVIEVSGSKGGMASLAGQLGGLANMVGVNLGAMSGPNQEAKAFLNSRRLVEEFIVRNDLMPQLYPKDPNPPSLWFAVRRFRGDVLVIKEDKRSGLTIVGINWTDPQVAARWANDFVKLANEMLRARAMAESSASIDYLNQQIVKTEAVEIKRVMYGLVESEMKNLMLANVKGEYAFAVIDPAVPPELRFSPRRTLMTLLGLVIGGILGLAAVFGRNVWLGMRATQRAEAAAAARV